MTSAKDVLKLIGLYIVIFIICFAVFVGLFHTPILAGMEVLMYRGLIFIILSGILSGVLMALGRKFVKIAGIKDIIMMFVIFCCVTTVFFTLVPVTVERSVSVFMLSYMEENSDRAFSQEEIEQIFKDKYVTEYGAFEKRFNEQIETGTIKKEQDGYKITSQGETIVEMFRTIADIFDTDRRLVHPGESGNS